MKKTVKKTVKKKIRKSHIAVLTGLALVLLIILGFVVAARIMAGPAEGWDGRRSIRGEGMGRFELMMNGGVLEGAAEGIGPIAARRVNIEGAGRVRELT